MAYWWVSRNGTKFGPIDDESVLAAIRDGRLSHSDWVCPTGGETWYPVSSIPAFCGFIPPASQSPDGYGAHAATPPKSRVAFILLGLFLGGFGVHNFYAGYIGRGAIQVILFGLGTFAIFCMGWLLYILLLVWIVVEVAVVDVDSDGQRMS